MSEYWFSGNRWAVASQGSWVGHKGLHFRVGAPKDNFGRCCSLCGRYTLVPVNFIPDSGKNFAVKIEPDVKTVGLRKKWSDYAEGFWCESAIFAYEETGGKKIRRGDSVSPDLQYYVIARLFSPPQEIRSRGIGTIRLNRGIYNVYLISIDISVKNVDRYKYVENYLLREDYGYVSI